MKKWFCGFSSRNNHSVSSVADNLPKPRDGEILWEGINSLWVCGNWQKQQVITVFEGPYNLAVIGTLLAPYQTLLSLFRSAIKNQDYSQLMSLPGDYNLIVQDEIDTYVFADAFGVRPVFYTVYDSFFVYSSLAVPLQQLTRAGIDLSWLASYLLKVSIANRAP